MATDSNQLLFERAILETKLIGGASGAETQRWLAAAASDYEKILARCDVTFVGTEQHEQTLSNLAETYMMLGRLDNAIEMYRAAYRYGADGSTAYGLAVALDRDDQPVEALDIIVQLGPNGREQFIDKLGNGQVFFVPFGERYYYLALVAEAFGDSATAIEGWRAFIASNAHPEFQPRARQHLDALIAKSGQPRKPASIDLEGDFDP